MARKDSGTVKIEVQAPRALMHEIMRTAIEAGHAHGIGYWAQESGNSVELVARERLYHVALRFEFPDGSEAQKKAYGCKIEIDERDIARGLGLALGGASDAGAQILRGDLDGPSADIIVQLAVFNEVVYG
jgi:hypothetical protein